MHEPTSTEEQVQLSFERASKNSREQRVLISCIILIEDYRPLIKIRPFNV